MGRKKQQRSDDAEGVPSADANVAAAAAIAEPALPWGMDAQEMQPSSLAALTDAKLARFVLGHQKKTKFEKEREVREARKRQADEEAAQMYAKFVASFEDEDATLGKAFVRAGSAGSGGDGAANKPTDLYRLQPRTAAAAVASSGVRFGSDARSAFSGIDSAAPVATARAPAKKQSGMERMFEEMKQQEAGRLALAADTNSSFSFGAGPPKKKRREIDEFLEELKERVPVTPTMHEMGLGKGSFDHGDPDTTNLYVGNLAPTVTEETLEALFGKYGEVFSVKIMWPRTEEERARRRNCGFVSFFERRDADEARVSLHDIELEGFAMVVGWGKAVKIDLSKRKRAEPVPATSVVVSTPSVSAAVIVGARGSTGATKIAKIEVEVPADIAVRERVDRLARYVATDGQQFENAIRARETSQSEAYAFLFDSQTPLATYYRWRVFAFAMGDDADSWRDAPFQMTVDGPVWVPPKMPSRASRKRERSPRSGSRFRRGEEALRRSRARDGSRSSSRSSSRGRSASASKRHRSRSSSSRGRSSNRRSASRSSSSSPSRGRDRDRRHRRSTSRSRSRGRRRRSRSSEQHSSRRRRHGDDSSDSGSEYDSRGSSPRHSRSRSPSRSRGRRDQRNRSSHNRSHERSRSGTRSRSSHATHESDRRGSSMTRSNLLTGQQIARARDIERGRRQNQLGDDEYDELQALLEDMTLERESVKQAMGYALDHSEAAVDIVSVILEAFKQPNASAVALVGYLYVTSDILHNSSAGVKNASLFRTTFQECLPEILERLRVAHKALSGRMSANAMKEKVLSVLSAWESWSLFPPMFLVGLNATFLRRVEESEYKQQAEEVTPDAGAADEERLRKTCRQAGILSSGDATLMMRRLQWLRDFTAPKGSASQTSVAAAAANKLVSVTSADQPSTVAKSAWVGTSKGAVTAEHTDDIDGEPMDDAAGQEREEDLDGEAMDEDVDGQPLDETEDDVDGEPLDASDEDVDGAPLNDDLDGDPM